MADYYHYKSRVGIFWIRPQPGSPGQFWLGIDDATLGSYASPMLAAGDVYTQSTGWNEWDSLRGSLDCPADIGEWHRGIPDIQ